jgi:hypothetical protein
VTLALLVTLFNSKSAPPVTANNSIPSRISERHVFRSKPVNARAIKAVIPTCKNWSGLRITVESLLNLKTPPAKIAVANDNPDPPPAWLSDLRNGFKTIVDVKLGPGSSNS